MGKILRGWDGDGVNFFYRVILYSFASFLLLFSSIYRHDVAHFYFWFLCNASQSLCITTISSSSITVVVLGLCVHTERSHSSAEQPAATDLLARLV